MLDRRRRPLPPAIVLLLLCAFTGPATASPVAFPIAGTEIEAPTVTFVGGSAVRPPGMVADVPANGSRSYDSDGRAFYPPTPPGAAEDPLSAPVPEPASLLLLGTMLACFGAVTVFGARRRSPVRPPGPRSGSGRDTDPRLSKHVYKS